MGESSSLRRTPISSTPLRLLFVSLAPLWALKFCLWGLAFPPSGTWLCFLRVWPFNSIIANWIRVQLNNWWLHPTPSKFFDLTYASLFRAFSIPSIIFPVEFYQTPLLRVLWDDSLTHSSRSFDFPCAAWEQQFSLYNELSIDRVRSAAPGWPQRSCHPFLLSATALCIRTVGRWQWQLRCLWSPWISPGAVEWTRPFVGPPGNRLATTFSMRSNLTHCSLFHLLFLVWVLVLSAFE